MDSVPALSDGQVWTGKTIDAGPETGNPGSPNKTNDLFEVTLSALAQEYKTTSTMDQRVNVVFVLDVSGSMTDNRKIGNAVSAANNAINKIHELNSNNKVGIVTFSDYDGKLVDLTNSPVSLHVGYDDGTAYVENNLNDNYDWVYGGTNIQSGINSGYKMLHDAKSSGDKATPIMIMLTDGVACFYNTNYTDMPTGSYGWKQDGNGYLDESTGLSSNGMTAAAYTIKQAAYLKSQMSDLQIFTIGYGTGSNKLSNATLNPTEANIAAANGGKSDDLYQVLGCSSAAAASSSYNYPSGSFSGTSLNLDELTKVFTGIIEKISRHTPLTDGTNLVVTDTISDAFKLSPAGSLIANLGGTDYTLTQAGGVYSNASLSGLTAAISGGVLTWTIPANLIPLNYYDNGLVRVNPITLRFLVELNNITSAGTYYTNYNAAPGTDAGAGASFTPVVDNPYYYTKTTTPSRTTNYSKNGWRVKVDQSGSSYILKYIKYNGTQCSISSATLSLLDIDHDVLSDDDYKFNISVTLADGAQIVINGIWLELDDGTDVSKNDVTVTNVNIPESSSYTPIPDRLVGSVAFFNMFNTGMIQLKNNVGDLIVRKNVAAYDNANKGQQANSGFSFSASIPGYTGTSGEIYNSNNTDDFNDDTLAGSFTITGGTATFALSDGQYAKISLIPDGTSYSVKEDDYSATGYTTAAVSNPGNATLQGDGSMRGTIVVNGGNKNNIVSYTNTFYPTATINLEKAVTTLYPSAVTIPTDKQFTFALYQLSGTTYSKITGVTPATISTASTPYTGSMTVKIKALADAGVTFDGNGNAQLYVHEDSMSGSAKGWTNDNRYVQVTINKNGSVSGIGNGIDNPVTFTNKYVPTASLTLSKILSGGGSNDKDFNFQVTLGTEGTNSDTFSYTTKKNDNPTSASAEATNGHAIITGPDLTLKANDKVVISDIPVGTPYTITEGDYTADGYISNLDAKGGPAALGNVQAGGSTVNVTNTYQTGNIIVTKTVTGTSLNDTFTFTVKMNGSETPFTGFYYAFKDGDSFGTPVKTTNGTFTLTNGQTVQLSKLPAGATYTITEASNSDYTTTNGVNDSSASTTGGIAQISALSADTSATPTVYFKNAYKVGSLAVTKQVLVDDKEKGSDTQYPITVIFTNTAGNYSDITGMIGKNLIENSNGTFDFSLKAGETAQFGNIPAGTTYTVAESDNHGADSVAYICSDEGTTKTIADKDADTVTITNNYLTPSTLKISKVVSDTKNPTSYKETSFDYEIYFYKTEQDVTPAVLDEEKNVVTPEVTQLKDVPYTLAADETPVGLTAESGAGYYTFSLKGGDSIAFDNLPVGVKFTVQELNDYKARSSSATVTAGTAYAAVGKDNDLLVAGSIPQDAGSNNPISIQYTNDYSVTPGSLTLVKSVDDTLGISNGTYVFTVTFTNQTEGISYIPSDTHTVKVDVGTPANGSITYTVTMTGAQSVKFDGLLIGTAYEVSEMANDADSTTMTGTDITTTTKDGVVTANGTMSTQASDAYTVQDATLTCTNTYNAPKLDTVKTVNKNEVIKNEDVSYTITVTNNSTRDLNLTKVEDPMYDGLAKSDITVTSKSGKTLDFDLIPGSKTPIVTLDSENQSVTAAIVINGGIVLKPGDSITITYHLSFATSGKWVNTATAYAYYNKKEIKATDVATVHVNASYSATIDKQVADGGDGNGTIDYQSLNYHPANTAADALHLDYMDTAVYKVTVENSDTDPLSTLSLSDELFGKVGSTATLVSVTLIGTDSSRTTIYGKIDGNAMTFYSSYADGEYSGPVTLTGGQQIEVIYTATANWTNKETNNNYQNTATLSAGELTKSISDTANVTINAPSISVTKSADHESVFAGQQVNYTITVNNTYDLPLDLASVTDTFFKLNDKNKDGIDDGDYAVSNLQYSIDGGTAVGISSAIGTSNGTIDFKTVGETTTYPSIPVGKSATITYTVTFEKAGTYGNTADVTAAYKGYTVTSSSSATVVVNDPTAQLLVDKLANGEKSTYIDAGQTVTYTVSVTNNGDVPLMNPWISDPMLAGATITGAKLNGNTLSEGTDYRFNAETHTINFNLHSFNVQDVIIVTYQIALTANTPNTATAGALTTGEKPVDPKESTAQVYINIIPIPPVTPPSSPTPSSPTPSPSPSPSATPSPSPSAGVLGDNDKPDAGDMPDAGVAGATDKLPQTGGISPSTLIGLLGLALIATGGTIFTIVRKKNHGKKNEQ